MATGANYRIGVGSAQVFDTNPDVNGFKQLIAQQQQKKAMEQKALADELATVKPDGLRNDADRKSFFDGYSELKNTAAQIQYERDPWKRQQLKSDVETKLLKLHNYANESKQQGVVENNFRKAKLAHPDFWGDDSYSQFSKSAELPVNHPDIIKDPNVLERQVDPDKLMKLVGEAEKTSLKGTVPQEIVKSVPGVGKKIEKQVVLKRDLPTEKALGIYGNLYDTKPDFSKTLKQSNPDILSQGLPADQTKQLLLQRFEQQRRQANNLTTYEPKANMSYTPPKITVNTGAGKDDSTFAQKAVAGIMNGDSGAINAIQSYLPQGSKIEHLTSQENPGVSKGGYNLVRLHIPEHTKVVNGLDVPVPGHDEDIPLATGDPKNRLNALISQYTPLKTNPSKFNTVGGKPRGDQIQIHAPVKSNAAPVKIKGTSQRLW